MAVQIGQRFRPKFPEFPFSGVNFVFQLFMIFFYVELKNVTCENGRLNG